jgi:ATP-dependent protease ClpP protease subunit
MSNRSKILQTEIVSDLHTCHVLLESREIFLQSRSDVHTDEAMIDHVSAGTFIKNIRLLNHCAHTPILIHMYTYGGLWEWGMAIYEAINCSESPTIILAYGTSRSMSSVIPQAATLRVITPTAYFMIHEGTTEYIGIPKGLRSYAERSKIDHKIMMDIYVERCLRGKYFTTKKMGRDAIRHFLQKKMETQEDWYISAEEAVYYGLYDGILGSKGYENIETIRSLV